jgi:hypothetical protein
MLKVTVSRDSVKVGERFAVSFQRTLRIPDDGRVYPLPPGLGSFPIHPVEEYADRVPAAWRERGGVFIPMYQREALWLGFDAAYWKPNAVKVGIGRVNAVSGEAWDEDLHAEPQDYVVCPDQPWLDGINAGDGSIRQFVAVPLGSGYTVEGQLTGKEEIGGIQLLVFEPRPGLFPDEPPPEPELETGIFFEALQPPSAPAGEMGLGAGGKMKQKIYPDPHGIDTWDRSSYGSLFVHIANSEQYRDITGLEPPPTPVSAQVYSAYGFPWFDLYDETLGDVAAPEKLSKVKSIHDTDVERGNATEDDETPIDLGESQVKKLGHQQS